MTEPLRRLTHQDVEFVWGDEQEKAFETLVSCFSDRLVIAYFDIEMRTDILVDASPVGLSAILVQYGKNGDPRVVAFGSRLLTETEQ